MADTSQVFLAIDLGASGGRVVAGLFDGQQLSLEEVYRFDNGGVHVAGHLHVLGEAGFHGSAATVPLTQPIVDIASTPTQGGYWLAAAGNARRRSAPGTGSAGIWYIRSGRTCP